jgi:hypothetical protein
MRELPPAARLYLGGVLALAASLAIIGTILDPVRPGGGAIAAVMLACATLAQQFKVKSPKHQSYYTTTIFFTGAAILLQPLYVVLIVVAAHAAEAIRVRQRWYIQAFNVANFVTCSMVSRRCLSVGSAASAAATSASRPSKARSATSSS